MNWLDLLVGVLGLFAIFDGFRRGFIVQTLELALFIGSVWLGLRYYGAVADYLVGQFETSPLIAKPLGFLALWLAAQGLGALVFWLGRRFIPDLVRRSVVNHIAGVVPALLKIGVYLGVGLTILLALPLPDSLTASFHDSSTGPRLVKVTSGVTRWLERSLGRTFQETFRFLTTPKTGVGYKIPAVTDSAKLRIEEDSEAQIFALVNGERIRAGLKPLAFDEEVRSVARAHSLDMWQRGFFDHVNPDGADVGDRLSEAGLSYLIAGENLALAPTVLIAHEGLMNSASHRENILHPEFGRLGIGVISAGAQGLMVTQNFRE